MRTEENQTVVKCQRCGEFVREYDIVLLKDGYMVRSYFDKFDPGCHEPGKHLCVRCASVYEKAEHTYKCVFWVVAVVCFLLYFGLLIYGSAKSDLNTSEHSFGSVFVALFISAFVGGLAS